MSVEKIGFLHPGQMGVSLAASAKNSGHEVYWVGQERSLNTRHRAEENRLLELNTLRELCDTCSAIVSICPPHAAEDIANKVLGCEFTGIYLDANAIAPERSVAIGEKMEANGVTYVDGGIVGLPAWKPGTTWLHLSGKKAADVASFFSKGPLETQIIDDVVGKASGLKMVFAAYTKGTTALLCSILGTAEKLGVRKELYDQWKIFGPDFVPQTEGRILGAADRAWRWVGEMEEISSTISGAGFPGGFHLSASEIYRRMAIFKDAKEDPSIEDVLKALLSGGVV